MHIGIGIAHCGVCTFEMANTLALIGYYQGRAGNEINIIGSRSCLPDENANDIIEGAIKINCDWLFILDTDIEYLGKGDVLNSMIAIGKPAMAGPYYQGTFPFRPVVYEFTQDKYISNLEEVPGGITRQDAAGAGFLLLRKDVIQLFDAESWEKIGKPFDPIMEGNRVRLRADAAFFWRLKMLGVELWVHGDIPLGHIKTNKITKGLFDASKKRIESWQNEKSALGNG